MRAVGSSPYPLARQHVHRGHDVGARSEDADQVVEVGPVGHVRHAVGLESQQCLDVVGGRHADRIDAAELAHVASDLLARVGIAADQVEDRVTDHAPRRGRAGLAGRPLDHPEPPAHSACRSGVRVEVSMTDRQTPMASILGRASERARHELVVSVGVADGPRPDLVVQRPGDLFGRVRFQQTGPGSFQRVVRVGMAAQLGVQGRHERVVVGRRGGPDEDGGDVDPGVAQFGPQGLGEDPLEPLAGVVGGEVHRPLGGGVGADEGDAAASPGHHAPAQEMAQGHRRRTVDGDTEELHVAVDSQGSGPRARQLRCRRRARCRGRRRPTPRCAPISGSARSATSVRVSTPCAARTAEAVSSSASAPRASIRTCRPRRAASWDSAAPIPMEAPATKAQGPYLSTNGCATSSSFMPGHGRRSAVPRPSRRSRHHDGRPAGHGKRVPRSGHAIAGRTQPACGGTPPLSPYDVQHTTGQFDAPRGLVQPPLPSPTT